jgi:hypothetical protein
MKNLFVALIKWYQKYLSPLKPPCCRFTPSCSTYTLQAIQKYGVLKGIALGCWRILRCNPFNRGGFDPVR